MQDNTNKAYSDLYGSTLNAAERLWIRNTDKTLSESYFKSYFQYRIKNNPIAALKDGAIAINDIIFTIPPQNISIQTYNNQIDMPILRSKAGVKIDTGQGEVRVSLQLTFTDTERNTLEEELMYNMYPLLAQLEQIPFFKVENEYIRKQLNAYAELDKFTDIMLSVSSGQVLPSTESPRIITLSLDCSIFNFHPYMSKVLYPADYEQDNGLYYRVKGRYTSVGTPQRFPLIVKDGKIEFKSIPFYRHLASTLAEDTLPVDYIHNSSNDLIVSGYQYYPVSKDIVLQDEETIKAALAKIATSATSANTQRDWNGNEQISAIAAFRSTDLSAKGRYIAQLTLASNKTKNLGYINTGNYDKLSPLFTKDRYKPDSGHSNMRPHHGVDILHQDAKLDKDSPSFKQNVKVLAAHDGVVSVAKWSDTAGYYVAIKTTDNMMTTQYMHLWSIDPAITVGKNITRGTTLGYMGDTGASQGIHLHYEVLLDKSILHSAGIGDTGSSFIQKDNGDWAVNPMIIVDPQFFKDNGYKLFQGAYAANQTAPELSIAPVTEDTTKKSKEELKSTISTKSSDKSNIDKLEKEFDLALWRSNMRKLFKDGHLDVKVGNEKITLQCINRGPHEKLAYIRALDRAKIKLQGLDSGLSLANISYSFTNAIAKVPINGYRLPAQQFMGGLVRKIALHFVVYNNDGYKQLDTMLDVFHAASDNALKYKSVASTDGVHIEEPFLNKILRCKRFMLDNVESATHPQIPGASVVTILLTDITGAHIRMKKALNIEQTYNRSVTYDGYIETMIKDLFTNAEWKFAYAENSKDLMISAATDGGTVPDSIYFINLKAVSLNSSVDDKAARKNIISELADIPLISSDLLSNRYKGSNYINIKFYVPMHSYGTEKKYEIFSGVFNGIQTTIDITVAPSGDDTKRELYEVIKEVIKANSGALYKLGGWPTLKTTYTDQAIKELADISVPAYTDFNLPPSIDPDFYFYQSNKCVGTTVKSKAITERVLQDGIERHMAVTKELFCSTVDKQIAKVAELENSIRENSDQFVVANSGKKSTASAMRPDGDNGKFTMYDIGIVTNFNGNDNREGPVYNHGTQEGKETRNSLTIGPPAKHEKLGKENFKTLAGFTDGASSQFNSKAFETVLYESMPNNGSVLDLMQAFPTFKIYVVERDDEGGLYSFRRDFNELYGLNAIQDIRFVEMHDQPADLLTISFIDLTGRWTSNRFRPWHHQEGIRNEQTIDTLDDNRQSHGSNIDSQNPPKDKRNPIKGIMLQEGTSIKFLAGYSNNINALEVKFNGIITSIQGNLNEYQMICQSYGMETVLERKFTNDATDIASFNADTQEILQWCIAQPEMKHFGRWKFGSATNYQFSSSPSGFTGFSPFASYTRIRPDGSTVESYTPIKYASESNIYTPIESNWDGWNTYWSNFNNSVWSSIFSVIAVWDYDQYLSKGVWTTYWVCNMTVWDIVQEMTHRYPGYIAKVMPYDDRVTLFFGPPNAPYFYRNLTVAENEKLQGKLVQAELDELEEAREDYTDLANEHWDFRKYTALRENSKSKKVDDITDSDFMFGLLDAQKESIKNTLNEYRNRFTELKKKIADLDAKTNISGIRSGSTKPFRQYHLASSTRNLIANNISADYRGVYTQVELGWAGGDHDSAKKGEVKDNIKMRMNDFLEDEDIRTKSVVFNNVRDVNEAHTYAAKILRDEATGLYKGNLLMLGNPKIKAWDRITLEDFANDTFGPLEVKAHVLTISPYEGMISDITPGMVASIRDLVGMSIQDSVNTIMTAQEYAEGADTPWYSGGLLKLRGNVDFADNVLLAGIKKQDPQMAVGRSLGLASLGWALSAMTATGVGAIPALAIWAIVGLFVVPLLSAQLGYRMLLAAKYRNPIILHPLIRAGAPYIHGLSSYKTLGLMAYYQRKWNLMRDDLESFSLSMSAGYKAITGKLFGSKIDKS